MKSADHTRIYSTPAIILRRIEFGDYDYILTFITPGHGKISAIAKNAKKSAKRFQGVLELFYQLDIVIRKGIKVSFLDEASIEKLFPGIRSDILKTAYASFWCEIIVQWLEEGVVQKALYELLDYVLGELDAGKRSPEALSIIFQMKFLDIVGFSPELKKCGLCNTDIDTVNEIRLLFDIKNGWLLCGRCNKKIEKGIYLSKGTVKQLLWLQNSKNNSGLRLKFSKLARIEALKFLEFFLPYHLEKELRSLNFLSKIRRRNI